MALNINSRIKETEIEAKIDRLQRNFDKGSTGAFISVSEKGNDVFFLDALMLESLYELAKQQKLESIGFFTKEIDTKKGKKKVINFFEPTQP
jgi:hypothetical protein